MPNTNLPTYRDLNYNAFLQKTTRNLADVKNVPGSISAGTDIAQSNTDAGKVAEATALTIESITADVSTALQTSAYTIVNASNQITAIAGNGITVYSGASASSGARIVLNSTGLAAYDSGNNATLTILSADGTITMKGSLTSGSTITGTTISGGAIDIGGSDSSSFHIDDTGRLWMGAASYVEGTTPLTISASGAIIALSFSTGVSGQNRVEITSTGYLKLYDSANNNVGKWSSNSGSMTLDGSIQCTSFITADSYLGIKTRGSVPSGTTDYGKLTVLNGGTELWFTDQNGTDTQLV